MQRVDVGGKTRGFVGFMMNIVAVMKERNRLRRKERLI